MRSLATLGPARLGVGGWILERTVEGPGGPAIEWVELVTGDAPPAYVDGLSVGPRITLLAGDVFATERAGAPVLRVEAS